MTKSTPLLLGLSLLAACNGGGEIETDNVQLDWQQGAQFTVAASYRIANVRTEEIPTALDGSPQFGEHWSEEVFWTYQVVEEGLVPDSTDELYPYAVKADGSTASPSRPAKSSTRQRSSTTWGSLARLVLKERRAAFPAEATRASALASRDDFSGRRGSRSASASGSAR